MLDTSVKEYLALQEELETIKAKMAELKTEIVNDMDAAGLSTYEVDDVKAQVVNKETIKYTEELALIKYLEDNGFGRFVVKKVDTTSMNKELKKSTTLNESLSDYVARTTAPTLIVKNI